MTAAVGLLEVTLYCPGSFSLKDKRSVTKSLIDRIRNDHNVSISTLGHREHHRLLNLGIAAVSSSSGAVETLLDRVEDIIARDPAIVLRETSTTIF